MVEFLNWLNDKDFKEISFIKNLYVNKDDRGKGIGSSLLKLFEDESISPIFLICDNLESQNEGFILIDWYKSKGYIETGFKTISGPILFRV